LKILEESFQESSISLTNIKKKKKDLNDPILKVKLTKWERHNKCKGPTCSKTLPWVKI
jgi:hypothetical protein